MRFIKNLFAKILLITSAALAIDQIALAQTQPPSAEDDFTNKIAKLENKIENTLSDPVIPAPSLNSKKVEVVPPLQPLSVKNPGKPSQLERAYLDAFFILMHDSHCSSFLGGPASVAALNEMVKHLKLTYLQRLIAVKMSGPVTTYQSNLTGATFRSFQKAELNLDGSFYRGNGLGSEHVPSVGNFQPNTRGARVTVLLHELGHLVQGADKRWILPDDGEDPGLSRANTFRILDVCGKVIDHILKNGP